MIDYKEYTPLHVAKLESDLEWLVEDAQSMLKVIKANKRHLMSDKSTLLRNKAMAVVDSQTLADFASNVVDFSNSEHVNLLAGSNSISWEASK